jgi:hypothetical protein
MWQLTLSAETPTLALSPTAMECRAATRHGYPRGAAARVLVKPLRRKQAALVRDLSTRGVGLVVADRIEPGASLVVALCGRLGSSLLLAAQAVHATPQADGRWHIGCRLTPQLDDAELALALDLDD